MVYKSITADLKSIVVVFLLFVFLFAGGIYNIFSSFLGPYINEVASIFYDPRIQWIVFLCLGIYFAILLYLYLLAASSILKVSNPNLWLTCALCLSGITYAFNYSPSIQALMLLTGAVIGLGSAVWVKSEKWKIENENNSSALVVLIFVALLTFASCCNVSSDHIFKYHNSPRWSGVWDNPNIAALLVGTGVVLVIGVAVSDGSQTGNHKLGIRKYGPVVLYLFAVMFMARGLLHSYSRGAWLGTCCGLAYLFWPNIHSLMAKGRKYWIPLLAKICLPLFLILISTFALLCWHFKEVDWHPIQRVFSAVNASDFSWRNRVAAWKGGLQIAVEHPWFGAGWNQPEPLYEHYYLSPKLSESAAIEMNDYLMLGATLGIPFLLCFGIYLWLSLAHKTRAGNHESETTGASQLQTTCRAGAIVLLVGFWFDSGLFKLPTASTFWILLALGRKR